MTTEKKAAIITTVFTFVVCGIIAWTPVLGGMSHWYWGLFGHSAGFGVGPILRKALYGKFWW